MSRPLKNPDSWTGSRVCLDERLITTMTTSRKARLKKIDQAERKLEAILLVLVHPDARNRFFRSLYYLARLAKKAR